MYAGPGPGQTPHPAAAAPQPPAMQAYNDLARAVSVHAQGNTFVYLTELKKLCLTILQADEITRTLQHRGDKVNGQAIFRQELQHQLLSYALMRVLPEAKVKEAAQNANKNYMEGLVQTPPLSPSGLMFTELEKVAGDNQQTAKEVEAELFRQPLFHMINKTPEAFAAIEQYYPQTADYVPQLLRSINQSMGLMVKAQASPAPAAQNFGPTPP